MFAKVPPTVIMLAGLQGAGKTSMAGKFALWLQGARVTRLCWSPSDLQRPNAVTNFRWSAQRSLRVSPSSRLDPATASAIR